MLLELLHLHLHDQGCQSVVQLRHGPQSALSDSLNPPSLNVDSAKFLRSVDSLLTQAVSSASLLPLEFEEYSVNTLDHPDTIHG